MATNKKTPRQKDRPSVFDLMPMPMVFVLTIICISLTIYIIYRAAISEQKLFSIGLLALFAGMLLESVRITGKWKAVLRIFFATYVLSLVCFLPGRSERAYTFEHHIKMWPYFFIGLYALITAGFNKDKVTARLTEGITLLQSLSIIYWTIDYGFFNIHNVFALSFVSIALAFAIFSMVHALTYWPLTRTVRLTLSIWSAVIMSAFAVDNIYNVYQSGDIETSPYFSQELYIGLQYFLLGVSAIYIAQNFMLLTNFMPSKNSDYKEDLKAIKEEHINRYPDQQVLRKQSVICIIYVVAIYGLNYKFQVLPRDTMIWLVFFTFPFVLRVMGRG